MAMKHDSYSIFISFNVGDHWVKLSKDIFDILGIKESETRVSLNRSPVLEDYCKGMSDKYLIYVVPLFSNEMQPGLIISIDSDENSRNKALELISEYYEDRIIVEDLNYDWPDNAEEILSVFNRPELILKDGIITEGQYFHSDSNNVL